MNACAARNLGQNRPHAMSIRMIRQSFFSARGRNLLPQGFVGNIPLNKRYKFLDVMVNGKVVVDIEQFTQTVAPQVVGDQQRSAGQGFKDAHVDIVTNAQVQYNSAGRIRLSHFSKKALADKTIGKFLSD